MGLLTTHIARLRNDPRIRKIPPYLSFLCMLGGIAWVLLLPLNEYSRQTYISENALLPGQVHTYFGGSEQNVFRAYKNELGPLLVPPWTFDDNGTKVELPSSVPDEERVAKIIDLFRNAGLKTAEQSYSYRSAGHVYRGVNVYAVLHAPRGDGTEAIVITAPIRNIESQVNLQGVALLISLARYFKRWSLWSKDIIFLVTPDSKAGPQAWIDAYHSTHNPERVADLSLKSGALQGAVCIDYPFDERFENFLIAYDGINGQLPNLDLFNTAVSISSGQMGIGTSIQSQHTYAKHDSYHAYPTRVQTLVRGMASQALGHATGPHSVFMPYHIDAITLTAIGQGWQDEMAFGRTVESLCRSLNNLLEKMHQSFFFYLLMQSNRFVSIGTYLPSAMAVAAGYSIMAIYLWIMSGYEVVETTAAASTEPNGKISTEKRSLNIEDKSEEEIVKLLQDQKAQRTKTILTFRPIDRSLTLPITLLTALHLTSLVPLYCLTTVFANSLAPTFGLFAAFSLVCPIILAAALPDLPNNIHLPAFSAPTHSQYVALKSLSLLVLGLLLTVLATLNFSLSIFLGVVCAPLAFVDRASPRVGVGHNEDSQSQSQSRSSVTALLQYLLLVVFSPVGVSAALAAYGYVLTGRTDLASEWLQKLAFGWNVWGSWGVVVGVLCIWWPAWTVGALLVASTWFISGVPATAPARAANVVTKSTAVASGEVKTQKASEAETSPGSVRGHRPRAKKG